MIIYHQDQDFVLARPPGELVCPLADTGPEIQCGNDEESVL